MEGRAARRRQSRARVAEQPVVCNGCVVLNFVLASSRTQGGLRSDTCSRVKECKLSYEQGARGGDAEKLQLALALLNLVAARAGDPSVLGGGQRCTTRRASELLVEQPWGVVRSTVPQQIHRDLHVPANLYLRPRCSMAWQCRFITAGRSQHGRVIAET